MSGGLDAAGGGQASSLQGFGPCQEAQRTGRQGGLRLTLVSTGKAETCPDLTGEARAGKYVTDGSGETNTRAQPSFWGVVGHRSLVQWGLGGSGGRWERRGAADIVAGVRFHKCKNLIGGACSQLTG